LSDNISSTTYLIIIPARYSKQVIDVITCKIKQRFLSTKRRYKVSM